MKDNLKTATIANIGYSAAVRTVTFLLSGIVSVVLARYLSAADYGIVGFAGIFIGFLSQFSDLGIGSAIIQKAGLDETGLYTGFTIKFIIAPVIFAIAFFTAPLATIFFDNKAIEMVIRVIALNFLINTFQLIPGSLLTRELNYRKLLIPQAFSAVVNAVLAVGLAVKGFGYWSIIVATIAANLTTTLLLNILRPVGIVFRFDAKTASEILRFGGNLFVAGFATYIVFNMDNFLIGSLQGADRLGYYALAFTWGSMICGIMASTIHSVLFPTFSHFQSDLPRLKSGYLRVLGYISFLGILANVTLLVTAHDFLFYILGRGTEKWLPALIVFRIFCVYGIVRTLLEPVSNVFMALGKTDVMLKSTIITAILELIALYPAIRFMGIEGAAIAVTMVYASQYFIYFPQLKKAVNLGYREVWAVALPSLLSASAALIMAGAVSRMLGPFLYSLLVKAILSVLVFVCCHGFLTRWAIIREVGSLILNFAGGKNCK